MPTPEGKLPISGWVDGGSYHFDPTLPIGFCIYCGEANPNELSAEHIFPEGLRGTVELKKASCKQCACKTSYSEGRILRGPIAAVRERLGWYGERRKHDRPDTLTLEILRRDGTVERLKLSAKTCPIAFRMPRFPAPRFLKAAHSADSDFLITHDYRKMDSVADEAFFAALVKADPGREKVLLDMEVFELSKVLAKIAYGYSVSRYGPHAIRPFVTDIIIAPRGQSPSFLHYVGGAFVDNSPVNQLSTTDIGKVTARLEEINGMTVVLVRIQLFGMFNMPVYEVVVGEHRPGTCGQQIYVPTGAQPMKTYKQLLIESGGLIIALKA